MMPFGHILSTLKDHPRPEYWDLSGPDIDREAAEHDGAILEIFDVRRIGNMVVTTGQYTFPAGVPDTDVPWPIAMLADGAQVASGVDNGIGDAEIPFCIFKINWIHFMGHG